MAVRRLRLLLPALLASLLVIGPGASRDFEPARILTPADVQTPAGPGTGSPWAGEVVTVEGVVTAVAPSGRFWYLGDPSGGAWSGLKVEGPSLARTLGESVSVTGLVHEVSGETRLESRTVRGRAAVPLPTPATITVADLLLDGERWEGVLVRIEDVTVVGETSNYGEFPIADDLGSGALADDEFFTSYIADWGDRFEWIAGVVAFGYGDFQLEPRSDGDFGPWTSGRPFDGEIHVTVTDGEGAPLPAKVTIFPSGGGGLVLGPDDRAEGSDDAAFLPPGGGTVRLPSGEYDVVVSRGIEYGIELRHVVVPSGGGADVTAVLVREVDSSGWISGDFHLHCAPSFDTPVPVPGRILSLAAEGVEWAIATDHNAITDYTPLIAELGLGDWMRSSIGDEITTYEPSFGHFNAWPLEAGRAPVSYLGMDPAALFAAARADAGVEVVQVNHPTIPDSPNQYFNKYGVSRYTGEPSQSGFSFDFDAVEVFNGRYIDEALDTMETWMRMLNAGRRITMTGNSDSHHLVFHEPGYPRNYVASPTDRPADAAEDALVSAVREGRSFVTYGPLLDFEAGGGGPGETGHPDESGAVAMRARIQWPSWLTVDSGRIWANGRVLEEFAVVARGEGPGDVTIEWVDHPTVDTWYVLLVEGPGDLAPVRRGSDFRPLAVTNPAWVDVDGDGEFTPPGNVADATTVDDVDRVDASGVPERLDDWVSVEGVATTDTGYPDPTSGVFYFDDGTGGVQIREASGSVTEVRRGDRVWVGGIISQLLGETVLTEAIVELRPPGAPGAGPIPWTTGALGPEAELLEGRVVRLSGLNVVSGSWPAGGSEGAVGIDDGSGPATLVIPGGVEVPPEASGLTDFEITALVTQRDFTLPYLSGYRFALRAGSDLFPDATGLGPEATDDADGGFAFGVPRPNPFRTRLAIPYRTPLGAPVPTAEIVNVAGRVVRRIAGTGPGRGEIVWDGRDGEGRATASGPYFVRLRAGDLSRVDRIVKLH